LRDVLRRVKCQRFVERVDQQHDRRVRLRRAERLEWTANELIEQRSRIAAANLQRHALDLRGGELRACRNRPGLDARVDHDVLSAQLLDRLAKLRERGREGFGQPLDERQRRECRVATCLAEMRVFEKSSHE
jgi:hypothetical protein